MTYRFKQYNSYKKSGLAWSSQFPEYWDVFKIFNGFYAKKGSNAAELTKEFCSYIEGDFPVYSGQTENNGVMALINRFEFDVGSDGCLFSTTVGAKAMTVMQLNGKFSLSQNCMAIFPRGKEFNSRFYFYHIQPLFEYERGLIPEHMQASFRMEDLYAYRVAVPPINEQEKIAAFLDRETAKIDELIQKQEKLIKALNERRTALICERTTLGLNKDVDFFTADIPWLHKIPNHWEISPLFAVAKENLQTNKGLIENNLLSLSYGRIIKKNIDSNEGLLPDSFETYQVIDKDSIVFRLTDLQNDKRSLRSAIVREKGIITSAYLAVIPYKILPEYFNYLMRAYDLMKVFYSMGGGLRQSMKFSDLKRLPILVPPLNEQLAIVQDLNLELEKQDKLIEKANQSIELLKEHRASLISAAVTGKIDVRELA